MVGIAAVQNLTCLSTWPRQVTKVKAGRQERCCSWSIRSLHAGTKRSSFCARIRPRQHRAQSSPKAAVSDQGPASCGPSIPERLIAASLYVWPVCEGAWRLAAAFESFSACQTTAEWSPKVDAAAWSQACSCIRQNCSVPHTGLDDLDQYACKRLQRSGGHLL